MLAKCFQTTSYSSPVLQSSSQIHAGKIHHSLTTRTAPPHSPLIFASSSSIPTHHPPSPIPPPPPPLRAYSPGPDGQLARQVPWYTVPSGHVLEPKPLFWPCRKPPAKPCHTAGHGGARRCTWHGKWWEVVEMEGTHRNVTKCLVEIFWMFGYLRLGKVRNEMSWTSTGETQNWFGKMWEWPLSK